MAPIEGDAPKEQDRDAIDTLFTYHSPTAGQIAQYGEIREHAKRLVRSIWALCPEGPDRTAAIRKVREAVMTANASIATENAAAKLY